MISAPSTVEQDVIAARSRLVDLKSAFKQRLHEYVTVDKDDRTASLAAILSCQESANAYFNYTEEFVGTSSLLGAHQSALWVQGFAEDCAEILKSMLDYFAFLEQAFAKLDGAVPKESFLPGSTAYANMQRMVVLYLTHDESARLKQRFETAKLPVYGFYNEAKSMDENHSGGPPSTKESTTAFWSFLQQALSLGVSGVKKSALPGFIGFLVYAGLVALLATGLWLNRPQVTAATIVLLMIVGLLALLLLLDAPKKIRPVVAEVVLVLVAICFLGVSVYAVVKLLNPGTLAGTQAPPMHLLGELQYRDRSAAQGFEISVGKGSAHTDSEGDFDLPFDTADVQNGKLTVHANSLKADYKEDISVDITPSTTASRVRLFLSRQPTMTRWTDPSTGLTWTAEDNGTSVSWMDAKDYCDSELAGLKGWRLPTIAELGQILDLKRHYRFSWRAVNGPPGAKDDQPGDAYVKNGITLNSCCVWSSEKTDNSASYFRYQENFPDDGHGRISTFPVERVAWIHALCVRDPDASSGAK